MANRFNMVEDSVVMSILPLNRQGTTITYGDNNVVQISYNGKAVELINIPENGCLVRLFDLACPGHTIAVELYPVPQGCVSSVRHYLGISSHVEP